MGKLGCEGLQIFPPFGGVLHLVEKYVKRFAFTVPELAAEIVQQVFQRYRPIGRRDEGGEQDALRFDPAFDQLGDHLAQHHRLAGAQRPGQQGRFSRLGAEKGGVEGFVEMAFGGLPELDAAFVGVKRPPRVFKGQPFQDGQFADFKHVQAVPVFLFYFGLLTVAVLGGLA